MKNGGIKSVLILSVLILISCSPVFARDFTVANAKDWQSVYLGTIYSGRVDSDFMFFTSLKDSQIKTKMMAKTDNILVLESRNNPVVKNYESLLKIDGYENYQTIYFDDYSDLQSQIFQNIKVKGMFIMEPEFGVVAASASPLIIEKEYMPFFINEDNLDTAKLLSKGKKTISAGRIPLRYLDDIHSEQIIGTPDQVSAEIMDMASQEINSDWGLILNIQEIDPQTLKQDLPIFIYFSDSHLNGLIDSVRDSGITKFEVVGPSMPDVAKTIEAGTGKNLDLMLKYGRTIVNYPGMEGKILALDSIPFDFPYESLQVVDATYYPNLEVIGITFKNTGNIDIMLFSNTEFLGKTSSDPIVHHLLLGQQKTIPFEASGEFDGEEPVTITTQYGYSIPFANNLKNSQNLPVLELEVSEDKHDEDSSLLFVDSDYDYKQDSLKIEFRNPNSYNMILFSEIEIGKNTWSSKIYEIEPNQEGAVTIRTPYTSTEEVSDKFFNVTTYFGEKDTLNSLKNEIYIEKYKEGISPYLVLVYIVITLLVVFIVFMLLKRSKKKKKY